MNTPIFEAVAAAYPGIHRASNLVPFPKPAPEPYISFIKERGAWCEAPFHLLVGLMRWSWS